jgi:hypothetical protein
MSPINHEGIMPMQEPQRKLEENNSWDKLAKWQTFIDEKIQELIGDGDMSSHPMAGKPLKLDEDSHVPEDMRLAYRMMKDNDAVPAWMALGFTLRDRHDKILRRLEQYARDFALRKQEALKAGSFVNLRAAEDRWESAIRQLKVDIARYNGELLNFNLQVPPSIGQRVPLSEAIIEAALKRAENAS